MLIKLYHSIGIYEFQSSFVFSLYLLTVSEHRRSLSKASCNIFLFIYCIAATAAAVASPAAAIVAAVAAAVAPATAVATAAPD